MRHASEFQICPLTNHQSSASTLSRQERDDHDPALLKGVFSVALSPLAKAVNIIDDQIKIVIYMKLINTNEAHHKINRNI